jgi:hypothetical protein
MCLIFEHWSDDDFSHCIYSVKLATAIAAPKQEQKR